MIDIGKAKRVIVATLGLLVVASCSAKDKTAVILDMIKKGAESAERHHIGDLTALASDDFVALPGRYDVRTVKGILFRAFKYYGNFNILYPRPLVNLDEKSVNATATVYFVIVRKGHVFPGIQELYDDPRQWVEAVGEKADLYQLKLRFFEKNSDWRVKSAHLKPFTGFGF